MVSARSSAAGRVGGVGATLESERRVAVVTTDGVDDLMRGPRRRRRLSAAELALRKGVRPVESLDDMVCDVFASDEELDEFLAFVYSERQAGHR